MSRQLAFSSTISVMVMAVFALSTAAKAEVPVRASAQVVAAASVR